VVIFWFLLNVYGVRPLRMQQ